MGISTKHALSREKQFYAIGTGSTDMVPPLGTDAMRIIEAQFDHKVTREDVDETRTTRSLMERTTEKATVTWSAKMYVRPSGTAGTPPDCHNLLNSIFGAYTNTPATSDVYSLDNSQVVKLMTMVMQESEAFQESIWGAIADKLTIDAQGGQRPTFSFEGRAMGYAHAGRTSLDADAIATGNISCSTSLPNIMEVGALIKVGSDDNSGAGFEVATDNGNGDFVVDGTVTSETSGAAVVPFVPTPTYAGSPASGITGSISIFGTTYDCQGINVVIDNGHVLFDDVAFQQYPSDAVTGNRVVSGKVQIKARADNVELFGKRNTYTTGAINLTIGSGAGTQAVLAIPYAELEFEQVDFPDGSAILNIPFRAIGDTAGDNEVTLTFT